MLIDCSYFTKGSRQIQNAASGTPGTFPDAAANEVRRTLEAYIAESQEEYLTRMLGSTLGNKVHTYLVCLDEDETPLRNAHYDEVCDRLRESFADFVFYRILRVNTQATTLGLVRLKCANEYVSPVQRQVMAWNAMVEKNSRFARWYRDGGSSLKGVVISPDMLTRINSLNL